MVLNYRNISSCIKFITQRHNRNIAWWECVARVA